MTMQERKRAISKAGTESECSVTEAEKGDNSR